MLRHDQLDVDRAMVLVIDLQEKLLPLITQRQAMILGARKLLLGSAVFDLPVLATEQYAKGLGPTDPQVRAALPRQAMVLEKPTFSAWADDGVRTAMLSTQRTQAILTGIETHVCIQQTALDLRSRDYDVFVCADAVGSRGPLDHETALHRLRQAGVFVTTVESVLFELCQRCDASRFKAMLEVIKTFPPTAAT